MSEFQDTIVAIATPSGVGGLGVIRLSGPNALRIADDLSPTQNSSLKDAPSHTLHHRLIRKADEVVDDAVFALFKQPKSYTGEDVVEISCHGSPSVLQEVVSLCQSAGARMARPGEFTQRAYVNGKLDLAQAEAVAELIHAQTHRARAQATDQLRGVLSGRIKNLRQQLLHVLAQIEANLDFVEEDIPPLQIAQLKEDLRAFVKEMQQLLSTSARARLYRQGLKIAFVGRPNAGKSSLFNALLASERAIVSDTPGTTRDTIEERLEWNGFPIVLVDTAGVRPTSDPIEEKGLHRTRQAQEISDIVFFIVDGSHSLTAEDEALAATLDRDKTIVVLNKMDLAQKVTAREMERWKFKYWLPVSALRAQQLDKLQTIVTETFLMADERKADAIETASVTNARHAQHLEKALTHIENALLSLEQKRTEESVSVDIRQALEELGAITGEEVTEALLSEIFAQFCIGK